MATPTPRRSLGRPPRPSTASNPNLVSSHTSGASASRPPLPTSQTSARQPSAAGASARKPSFGKLPAADLSRKFDESQAHTPMSEAGSSPMTMYPSKAPTSRTVNDDRNANQNLEVGDIVDVPGSMHGTIRFIGEVKGKKGHFAGVELSKEFASRGKNDGDVDGWVSQRLIHARMPLLMRTAVYDILPHRYAVPASSSHLIKPISACRLPFHPVPCPIPPTLPLKTPTASAAVRTPELIHPPHHRRPQNSVNPLALAGHAALTSSPNKDHPCLAQSLHYERHRMQCQRPRPGPLLGLQNCLKA